MRSLWLLVIVATIGAIIVLAAAVILSGRVLVQEAVAAIPAVSVK